MWLLVLLLGDVLLENYHETGQGITAGPNKKEKSKRKSNSSSCMISNIKLKKLVTSNWL